MSRFLVWLAGAVCLCSCVGSPDHEGAPEALVVSNRLAANRLAANRLAANRLAANRLAANSLSSTRLEAVADTADLLANDDGRWVYSYLVSCALPSGTSIEADVPGAPDSAPPLTPFTCASEHCVFEGEVGLTVDWIDHKLSREGRGWISACVFARVNANDTAQAVSLRGNNPALLVSPDEAELYSLEEGAFYGDLFTGTDAIDWFACRGRDQAAGEAGGLVLRDCTEPDPTNPGFTLCGFHFAGDCADFTPEVPSPYACRSFDAAQGVYDDCHETEGLGKWASAERFREVITAWVSP